MPVMLKDVPSLMINYKKWPQSMEGGWMTGFNDCIDQIGSRKIGLNKEKIVEALLLGHKDKNSIHLASAMADALIAQEASILECKE
jgi:hypothetical protein